MRNSWFLTRATILATWRGWMEMKMSVRPGGLDAWLSAAAMVAEGGRTPCRVGHGGRYLSSNNSRARHAATA